MKTKLIIVAVLVFLGLLAVSRVDFQGGRIQFPGGEIHLNDPQAQQQQISKEIAEHNRQLHPLTGPGSDLNNAVH